MGAGYAFKVKFDLHDPMLRSAIPELVARAKEGDIAAVGELMKFYDRADVTAHPSIRVSHEAEREFGGGRMKLTISNSITETTTPYSLRKMPGGQFEMVTL